MIYIPFSASLWAATSEGEKVFDMASGLTAYGSFSRDVYCRRYSGGFVDSRGSSGSTLWCRWRGARFAGHRYLRVGDACRRGTIWISTSALTSAGIVGL